MEIWKYENMKNINRKQESPEFSWIFPKKDGGEFLQKTPILNDGISGGPKGQEEIKTKEEYCSYVVEVPVEDILWTNIHKHILSNYADKIQWIYWNP